MIEINTNPIKITISMDTVIIVKWFKHNNGFRGQDKTGSIYQFKDEQIIKEDITCQ